MKCLHVRGSCGRRVLHGRADFGRACVCGPVLRPPPVVHRVGWSGRSWRRDTNVILADEMGLGKTVQSVSMIGFLFVSPGPSSVCKPHVSPGFGTWVPADRPLWPRTALCPLRCWESEQHLPFPVAGGRPVYLEVCLCSTPPPSLAFASCSTCSRFQGRFWSLCPSLHSTTGRGSSKSGSPGSTL